MFKRILVFNKKHKIVRGMLSYGTFWPSACLVQQTLVEKRTFKNYDYAQCIRFSIFGAFFMAPTLYVWFRLAEAMWPKRNLSSTLSKIFAESISYDPMAISNFFLAMTLMKGRSLKEAKNEVKSKFVETYKADLVFWPFIQIVNFSFIPPPNQVVFVSFFSFLATSFLAYID